ncbi:kinase-like protein [Neurospora crassa]|uniref:Protein kinase Yak1 n=1 Tax=Neurospora crassa (strain ATCC 24698 / 74-OR23-1A / CBS 708.71 / DSM 1257 / FGSC 987) TaxID=367110 RepID=Q7SBT7_NEUCR|nr:protein kinase Yak1 [Neurospora crassa OR74A]EAA33897.2 protein kinase Yak1 [Neurospora crassa OR74A]KHE84701.1 kinase-like protein [Neurospora crassa]|eukprot:XP_963133.2 protein kinase Yak1 [Neurospora crassa OR74A]
MEQQWQPYSDSAASGSSRRYNNGSGQMSMSPRDYASNGQVQAQQQPLAGYKYDPYQAGLNPSAQPQSSSISPMTSSQSRDANGDVAMQDAHDPYSSQNPTIKYPLRPHHSLSGGRPASLSTSQEPSAAAQRYSPMEALSPASQYPKGSQFSPAQRQSPTRPNEYAPPQSQQQQQPPQQQQQQSPYYTSRQASQQLPPINPYAPAQHDHSYPNSAISSTMDGSYMDPKSPPRRMNSQSQQMPMPERTPVPEFRKIRGPQDLRPKINKQPAHRRANPEGGFISPLQALTVHLPATYRICNPGFKYESSRNPRRVLTKPSKGVKNDGYDNEDSDYILYVNDILGSEEAGHKNRYLILDVLGQGTFGQVVKCQNLKTQEVVAVKVIKNRTAYFNQSMMEVSVLDLLNTKLDKNDDHHLLRLKDTFIHRQHLCLVFELLSVNLYELIKQNQFRGLSTTLVRVFAQQLLNGLSLLNKARLIHCDLKPENILLKNLESPIIKIIDFGSACDERQTVYTYIQSRFYRSPEVLLGLPYSSAIDMWSLGCIVVELFLGLPLFPGSSEYNQVSRIVEMLGNPPNWMIEMGKQAGEFFEKRQDEFGRKTYHLKSMEQYSREHGTKEQPSKKYFQANTLPEIIKTYPMPRKNMKQSEIDREMNNRIAFIDFVRGLLTINPLERWSPQQAKLHPFITQSKFTGPFVPPMNLKSSSLNRSPAPGTQQQIQAEAFSKQKAQQAQANAIAANQAQNPYGSMATGQQYPQQTHTQPQPLYSNNNIYAPGGSSSHASAPPPYGSQQGAYPQQGMPQQQQPQVPQVQMPPANYAGVSQSNLYAQQQAAAAARQRQRSSTMEQQQSGIPVSIQRVASHLDPTQPIRLQPSPAYYPPPPDGLMGMDSQPSQRMPRRGSRAQASGRGQGNNRDFIRNLEERTLEEGFMGGNGGGQGQSQWH